VPNNTNSASPAVSIRTSFQHFREGLLSASADPGKETVHHLRTNTRRIETIVQSLLTPDSEKKLLGQLKKIRRVAGDIRDLDVLADLVKEFESQDANSLRSRAFVSARLDLMRARDEKELLQMLDRERIKNIETMLNACERKLATAVRAEGREDLLSTALTQYTDLARRFDPLHAGNLHEFRKASKHVRYVAELGSDGVRKEQVLEQLKRIQDSVGEWHDVIVLLDTSRAALKNPKKSAFLRELRDVRDKKLQAALKTAEESRHELLRLQLQVMTAPRKAPRATGPSVRAKGRRRAAS
jgi:CHAD domain-containing protein